MTFYSSLLFGFCVGVLAVFGLRKVQRHKSTQRMQRAVENAMLGSMNKDDLAKLLPKAFFPSWVQFQDFERVRWLNLQLKDLWPHINKATQDTISEMVEPVLNKNYKPAIIASMTFSKLTLGNVPPEVDGIQVVNTGEDKVELRIQVKWAGNPTIAMAISTKVGAGLQIQVKDLRFWGTFRVILAPLVDQLPCFGAITAALVSKPTIDYSLKVVGGGVIGGDIDSIPTLRPAIDGLIHDAINDMLVWPARLLIPVLPGDYSHLEMHESAKLDVRVVEAKLAEGGQGALNSLMESAVGKTIDLFAKVYVRKVLGRVMDTFTVHNTDHPLWGQSFQLAVEDKETQKLTAELWALGELASTQLGMAEVTLKELPVLSVEDLWLPVMSIPGDKSEDPKEVAKVRLELTYRPLGPDGLPIDLFANLSDAVRPSAHRTLAEAAAAQAALNTPGGSSGPDAFVTGVIKVTVIRGKNLLAKDTNGFSDPFVTISTLKAPDVRKKSKVIFKTLDPEWHQTFELWVTDARNDMVVVRVYDHDLLGMRDELGWYAFTLTKVIQNRIVEGEFKLEEGGEGVLEMRIEWTTVVV